MKVTQTSPATTPNDVEQKPRVFAGFLCPIIHRFLSSPSSDNRQKCSFGRTSSSCCVFRIHKRYGKITFRFGVQKMTLIQNNLIKYVMEEMALSYLGRRNVLTFISDLVKVKKKKRVSLSMPWRHMEIEIQSFSFSEPEADPKWRCG